MQAFWFGVIAVLWAGFFLLEGFDFGVGMLVPLVGRDEAARGRAIRAIGPVWDGNEVWLLVAGGATFAAFPEWYASLFSGFYLAFALLLVGLIVRGIGIEYRGKVATASGRRWCDAGLAVGSLIPALLVGVAFANLARGLTLDAGHHVTDGFLGLLTPYTVLGGLLTLTLFAHHGATFLVLRTDGEVAARARAMTAPLGSVAAVLGVVFLTWTAALRGGWVSYALAAVIAGAVVGSLLAGRLRREGWAFVATGVATALVPIWAFAALWPDVLPARNDASLSLTVHNASSTHYTLVVMTVVALIFTPAVVAYQAWAYWVFRARVTGRTADAYGPATAAVEGLVAKAAASARETLGTGLLPQQGAPEAERTQGPPGPVGTAP
jgi:cytochrome d ubiquinol oxidase subunit II